MKAQLDQADAPPHEASEHGMREVHEAEWSALANQFSRLHTGQPAVVETRVLGVVKGVNAQFLPLMGVTAEADQQGATRIEIVLGDSPTAHFAHAVSPVTHVRVAEWNDSVSSTLEIESEDGRVTLLHVGPDQQTLPEGFITDGVPLQHQQFAGGQ